VVRTFNRPNHLLRALSSLAAQTISTFEVIVVNDAGLDPSPLIEPFMHDMPIRLITLPANGGPAAAANAGLHAGRARLALLHDDDDTVLPNHLELLLGHAVASQQPVLVHCPPIVLIETPERQQISSDVPYTERPGLEQWELKNQLTSNGVLFDRQLAIDLGGFDTSLDIFEDWDLWLRLAERSTLQFSPQPTARRHIASGRPALIDRAGPNITPHLLAVYGRHRSDDLEVEARRDWQAGASVTPQLGPEHTIAILGDGDAERLMTCLRSVVDAAEGTQYEVVIHEVRNPATERVLSMFEDECICFDSGLSDEARLARVNHQRAGQRLTVVRTDQRLIRHPLTGELDHTELVFGRDIAEHDPTGVVYLPPAQSVTATITTDYAMVIRPRYGYGEPRHEAIGAVMDAGRDRYASVIEDMLSYGDELAAISLDQVRPPHPYWNNTMFKGLDAALMYTMVRSTKPAQYIEVGAGSSTLFARQAINDGQLSTKLTAIDPGPRALIMQATDEMIYSRLEDADLEQFAQLQPGDMCSLDGSHYTLPHSDVSVFFLEILPRLRPGITVHIHDIFWPYDYPPQWNDRAYSEQYLLGMKLLERTPSIEVVAPSCYIAHDPELSRLMRPLWQRPELQQAWAGWCSFWFTTL
ncbi:MAG: hypothetical protein JWL70_2970, partial [Acidimicrobiia bacterium]|nr:hypothetical protein [Acidimicrobiia bacterium]